MIPDKDELLRRLEETGEDEVREKLALGLYGQPKIGLIEAWLARKGKEREEASQQRQEGREDESLRLASDANRIAERANRIAVRALVGAAIGLLLSIIALVRGC